MGNNIYKPLAQGKKLKKGDFLEIPNQGIFKVEGFYKTGVEDLTVAIRRTCDEKLFLFGESNVAKFKTKHLRLIK